MCSSPKSSPQLPRLIVKNGFVAEMSSQQRNKFTAIANAAEKRRQLKATTATLAEMIALYENP